MRHEIVDSKGDSATPPLCPPAPHTLPQRATLIVLLLMTLTATACLAHWGRTMDRQIARQHRDGVRARLLAESGLAYAQALMTHYLAQTQHQSVRQNIALPTSDAFDDFTQCVQQLLDHALILDGAKTIATVSPCKRTLTVPHITLDGGRSETFTLVFQLYPDNAATMRLYSVASSRGAVRHLSSRYTIERRPAVPHYQHFCGSSLISKGNPLWYAK